MTMGLNGFRLQLPIIGLQGVRSLTTEEFLQPTTWQGGLIWQEDSSVHGMTGEQTITEDGPLLTV